MNQTGRLAALVDSFQASYLLIAFYAVASSESRALVLFATKQK